MCGIVGYIGNEQAAPILLEGLTKLEYRGYDSSGIAVIDGNEIKMIKAKGRLLNLYKKTDDGKLLGGKLGIGHTRWATHGEPSDTNSHPHVSSNGQFAIVHNGIIENYLEIKDFLKKRNFNFLSETDTEVIALLFEYYYNGNIFDAIRKVINKLSGSYALGILHALAPNTIYAVRRDSPLVIGLSKNENFIASDMPALLSHTRDFILLNDFEVAEIKADCVKVYNMNHECLEKAPFVADWDVSAAEKDGYPHYMLKEINEQPDAIRKTLNSQVKDDKINLDKIGLTKEYISTIKKINIIGCGSAYHAGIVGKYLIESLARIPVEVDLASEFRYRSPIVDESTLTIIISQSGETADTIAALRETKKYGSKILSIVNVVGSSIARESDYVFYTLAGPEISVATTKGYTTQVAALSLIGIYLAQSKSKIDEKLYKDLISGLTAIPEILRGVIKDNTTQIQQLASMFHGISDSFFIGRGLDYAASLEGSLKLKEISYIHAEAYAAGELKHGTISLIEKGTLVIALATDEKLKEKTLSNANAVKSRGACIISIVQKNDTMFEKESDYCIYIPNANPLLTPILTAAILQLFGYYMAAARGLDIDKPRNLAKSVTVE